MAYNAGNTNGEMKLTDILTGNNPPETQHLAMPAGASTLRLPLGDELLSADFNRAHYDLHITLQDGGSWVISEYFAQDSLAALITDSGKKIVASAVETLAGPIAPGEFAGPETLGEAIGAVEKLEGEVTVRHADGTTETLQQGDLVYQDDVIETGSDGSVGITFKDDSVFALGEDARMTIDELVYDPETGEGNSNINVLKGMFKFVSGEIAAQNPGDMMITTPVATIGIRGTTGGGMVEGEGGSNQFFLAANADGTHGKFDVVTEAGRVTIDQPFNFVEINTFDQPMDGVNLQPMQTDLMSAYDHISSATPIGKYEDGFAQGRGLQQIQQSPQFMQQPGATGNQPNEANQPNGDAPENKAGPNEKSEQDGSDAANAKEASKQNEGENTAAENQGEQQLTFSDEESFDGKPDGNDGDSSEINEFGRQEENSFGGLAENGFGSEADRAVEGAASPEKVNATESLVQQASQQIAGGTATTQPGTTSQGTLTGTQAPLSGVISPTGTDAGSTTTGIIGTNTIRPIIRTADSGSTQTADGSGGTGTTLPPAGTATTPPPPTAPLPTAGTGSGSTDNTAGQHLFLNAAGTLVGGAGSDWLEGSDFSDLLDGGRGHDEIEGHDGNDTLRGGDGNDILEGGDGNDLLSGGAGDDTLIGDADTNMMTGGVGKDVYFFEEMGIPQTHTITDFNPAEDRIFFGPGPRALADLIITQSAAGTEIAYENITITLTGITVNISNLISFLQRDDSANLIDGTTGHDLIWGGGGDDTMNGLAGDDELHGDEGNDLISGGIGHDELFGGDGDDVLQGGAGNDHLHAEGGFTNTLMGGDGDDYLEGGAWNDSLDGGAGNDHVHKEGYLGASTLSGGTGHDFLSLHLDGDTTLSAINWSYISGFEDIRFTEETADTLLTVSLDAAAFTSGAGVENGHLFMDAASLTSDNIFILDLIPANASLELLTGSGDDTITETVGGLDGDLRIHSGAGADSIFVSGAGAGRLAIFGGDADDMIDISGFTGGPRHVEAGDHNDEVTVAQVNAYDWLDGNAGYDTLLLAGTTPLFDLNRYNIRGFEEITGSSPSVTGIQIGDSYFQRGGLTSVSLDLSSSSGSVTLDARYVTNANTSVYLVGGVNADNLTGGYGDDTLQGDASSSNGNDIFYGGYGADEIRASGGSNMFYYKDPLESTVAQSDTIIGFEATDMLYIAGYDGIALNNPTAGYLGYTNNTNVTGTAENDIVITSLDGFRLVLQDVGDGAFQEITLTAGTNVTTNLGEFGAAGTASGDMLIGTVNNDNMTGGDGGDTLYGSDGHDTINGDAGNDILVGGHGDDQLYGGAGWDTLEGGAGNDILYMDEGDVLSGTGIVMSGGSGHDTLYVQGNTFGSALSGGTLQRAEGIEVLKLGDNGNAASALEVTSLNAIDVRSMTDDMNVLFIEGHDDSSVELSMNGWTQVSGGPAGYSTYTSVMETPGGVQQNVTVHITSQIEVTIASGA